MIHTFFYHRIALSTLIACFAVLTFSNARADEIISDLSQSGWKRDASLLSFKIDRYKTSSESMTLELMAFPATQKSAGAWIDEIIIPMTAEDRAENLKVHSINVEEAGINGTKGAVNSSSAEADIATRTVMVTRPGRKNKNLLVTLRAVVRKGKPVQFSILTQHNTKLSDVEHEQANKIRFNARVPLNQSAAFLGRDAMVKVMTSPLIYPQTVAVATKPKQTVQLKKLKLAAKKATARVSVSSKSGNNSKGSFSALPGPQVRITGKMLGSLPSGYRMQVRTTNYWTSSDMTSTRQILLTLTKDGQFEFGNFSISGGMGGVTGTIHSSDKKGSVGTVYGDTNPEGSGARSVALSKKTGLDGSKYGTYYITGNQIEFAYANGKTEKRSFITDGYKTLTLNKKKFFVDTPDGWERRDKDKIMYYRSLNGVYRARVTKIDNQINNGRKWMEGYISRLKAKKFIKSAAPIKTYKGRISSYNVVNSTITLPNKNGGSFKQDLFLKNGQFKRQLIRFDRFTGAKGDKALLDFIYYLD